VSAVQRHRRARALAISATTATAALLVASTVACDTVNVGSCNGVVKAAIHEGLVIASVSAVCAGQQPSQWTIVIYLYANGQLVAQNVSTTIPDASGYAISVSVVCVADTTYKAIATGIGVFPDGEHKATGSSTVRVKNQGDCSQTFNP
jgi:hypothetical protein